MHSFHMPLRIASALVFSIVVAATTETYGKCWCTCWGSTSSSWSAHDTCTWWDDVNHDMLGSVHLSKN